MADATSVSEMISLARATDDLRYDNIGFRFKSLSLYSGESPLETLAAVEADSTHQSPMLSHVLFLRKEIQHLSIDIQFPFDGRMQYQDMHNLMEFRYLNPSGKPVERFVAKTFLPNQLHGQSSERDAAPMLAQRLLAPDEFDFFCWVKIDELIDEGRFLRMQDWTKGLTSQLDSGCFYLFVSHRWLTVDHPDPEGRQAVFLVWQILGCLIEAIWVLAARGKYTSRKISGMANTFVGFRGNELSESILVNLLRRFPDDDLSQLIEEAEQFDDIVVDLGVGAATQEANLSTIRDRLENAPAISNTLSRFRIWYDYSCMPQLPRSPGEQIHFEKMLNSLGAIQSLGRTVVLLDEIPQYFGRGWCTYEATLSAEYLGRTLDVLNGSESPSIDLPSRSHSFHSVLKDRCHLIHRGIMDTEVFGIQTSDECLTKLGLETTRPQDREIVYGFLKGMGAPFSMHFDDGEVVTGVLPLPITNDGTVAVGGVGRQINKQPYSASSEQLADASELVKIGSLGLPPFEHLEHEGSGNAHLVVLGRCEGEAVLYTNWSRDNRERLEEKLGIRFKSMSWLASDIAPVGHMPCGNLTIQAVEADIWVLLGPHAILHAGHMANIIMKSVNKANIPYIRLEVDTNQNNVTRYKPDPDPLHTHLYRAKSLQKDSRIFKTHKGGLFREQLIHMLGAKM